MRERILKIGTRGSRLALEQTRRVRERLSAASEVVVIRTAGDRLRDETLGGQQEIGFFTKEIEKALLAGRIDLAVHSLKDLPSALVPDLTLAAHLERDAPSDVLLVHPAAHQRAHPIPLKRGAAVGASAMRRQALLKTLRADLVPAPIRGNVPTRIDKLRRGEYDAIILARAGLARLRSDTADLLAYDLNPRSWICAPGQGVIAVEARRDDAEVLRLLAALDHHPTRACVGVERALLAAFGGGCHAPFGAWARTGETCSVLVAAPGSDGNMRFGRFRGDELDEVRRRAEAWIRSGRPATPAEREEEWTCRPARPWC